MMAISKAGLAFLTKPGSSTFHPAMPGFQVWQTNPPEKAMQQKLLEDWLCSPPHPDWAEHTCHHTEEALPFRLVL